jgi:hypothetical protein
MLILGNGVYDVAKKTGVPKSTVARWQIEENEVVNESLQEDRRGLTPKEFGKKMGLSGPISEQELSKLYPFRR